MGAFPAAADGSGFTVTASDPRLGAAANFRGLVAAVSEEFVDVSPEESKPLDSGEPFSFTLSRLRCGMLRMVRLEAAPFRLVAAFRRSPRDGYAMLLSVLEGEAQVRQEGGGAVSLSGGQAVIYDPGEKTSITAPGRAGIGLVLLSSSWLHSRCGHLWVLAGGIPLGRDNPAQAVLAGALRGLFEAFDRIRPQDAEDYCEGLCCLLRPVVAAELERRRVVGPSHAEFLRDCAVQYMLGNLGDAELSPGRIAGAVGISGRYLAMLFREAGVTVGEKLKSLRLERAAAMLESESSAGMTVAGVAERCGFANASYFGRVFRKRYGMTPLEWRRRTRDFSPGTSSLPPGEKGGLRQP